MKSCVICVVLCGIFLVRASSFGFSFAVIVATGMLAVAVISGVRQYQIEKTNKD